MNAPIVFAQLSGSQPTINPSPRNLKIVKPPGNQAVTINLDGSTKLDFSDVASEKLTFVRVGDKLIVLFDNQSTVTIDPVYANGETRADVVFDLGSRVVNGTEFAELFPITTDQSVLPAAGAAAGGPTAGANFSNPNAGSLGDGNDPLALLGNEETSFGFGGVEDAGNPQPILGTIPVINLDDEGLDEGNLGGPGDIAGAAISVTQSLNVNFGTDAPGAFFLFQATQPTLSGLTSGGQAITIVIINNTAGAGVPTIIGFVGGDPTDPANVVFTVTLDNTAFDGTFSGAYTFTLSRPLDHPIADTEDTITLTIGFSATDGSGDTALGSFGVAINDDSPEIVLGDVENGTVNEDVLPGRFEGEPNGNPEQSEGEGGSTQSVSATGSLGIQFGADRFDADDTSSEGSTQQDGAVAGSASNADLIDNGRSVYFTNTTVLVNGVAALLTSQGETVLYKLDESGTKLIGYVPGKPIEGEGEDVQFGEDRVIFTVSLSDDGNGSYDFTLFDELDHPVADADDDLALQFNFTARDSDSDTIGGNFVVTVNDDTPIFFGEEIRGLVHEDALTSGNPGDSYSGPATEMRLAAPAPAETPIATGSLSISWGADNFDTADSPGLQDGAAAGSADNTQLTGRAVYFTNAMVGLSSDLEVATPLTSRGEVVQYRLDESGTKLIGYVAGDGKPPSDDPPARLAEGPPERVVFTITLSDDGAGSYRFELTDVIDHPTPNVEDNIRLTFNITARDFDKDTVSSTIAVTVNDDAPLTNAIDDQGLTEITSTAAANTFQQQVLAGVSLNISWGADDFDSPTDTGLIDRKVAFADGLVAPEGLTSNGEAISYGFDPDRTTLTATAANGRVVFTVSLSDDDAGTYTFILNDNIDHVGEGSGAIQALDFSYVATDADGDATAPASFRVNVTDDVPTIGKPVNSSLDEEGLSSSGNSDAEHSYAGDLPGGATTVTASLSVDWNSDDNNTGSVNRSLVFDGVTNFQNATYGNSVNLTSDGEQVKLVVVGSILYGYVGNDPSVGNAPATGARVFTVSLDDVNGNYTFTLLDNLDHPTPNAEDDINLVFGFRAIDADGDSTTPSSFTVAINDDGPRFTRAPDAGTVDEEFINGSGNTALEHSYPGDVLFDFASVTGDLNIAWGLDDNDSGAIANRSVSFLNTTNNQAVTFGSPPANLTSNGSIVRFIRVSDTELVGVADDNNDGIVAANGRRVFEITISDNGSGSYEFEILDNIDHPVRNVEDNIVLNFTVQAKDADGDTVSANLAITVNDDAPRIGSPDSESVNEDDLANGNDSIPKDSLIQAGDLEITWGIDDNNTGTTNNRSVAFETSLSAPSGLTSNGEAITYTFNAERTLLTASAPGNRTVFTVSLSDTGSGEFTFTLVDNIDHATSGGNDDSRTLNFGFRATDSDGDTTGDSFSVTIVDDEPVIGSPVASTLTENTTGSAGAETFVTSSSTQSLAIAWGADDANPGAGSIDRTVRFSSSIDTGDIVETNTGANLTSNGRNVQFVRVSDTEIFGVANDNGGAVTSSDRRVFRITLSDTNNGSYTFELLDNVDHVGSGQGSSLGLSFDFVARDADGDTDSDDFVVTIRDDEGRPSVAGPITGSLTENTTGAAGAEAFVPANATGSLNVSWGSDDADPGINGIDRSVSFSNSIDTHDAVVTNASGNPALRSNGHIVRFVRVSDTEILGIGDDNDNGLVAANGRVVFRVTLSDNGSGSYNFELLDNIDHTGTGQGSAITLNFGFTARDADGDTDSDTLSVTVTDDVLAFGTIQNASIDEESVPGIGGNAGGGNGDLDPNPGTDVAGPPASRQVGGTFGILWGSDDANSSVDGGFSGTIVNGDRSLTVASDAKSTLQALNLTSSGVALDYTINASGTLLTATKGVGGATVFTVSLSDQSTGSYTFKLFDNLDHAAETAPGTENDTTLTIKVIAHDGDGDASNAQFTVTIDDDAPIFTVANVQNGNVDDEGLSGNAGLNVPPGAYAGSDLAGEATTASGNLGVSWGADDNNTGAANRSLAFRDIVNGTNVLDSTGAVVKSHGLDVKYFVADVAGVPTLIGYTGSDASIVANQVFKVTLDDSTATGGYNFQLLKPLDHPTANTEDDRTLNFSFTAKDADGDSANGSFSVTIDDDAPVIVAANVQNGFIDEENLSGGNIGGDSSDMTAAQGDDGNLTATGTLGVSYGADGPAGVVGSAPTATTVNFDNFPQGGNGSMGTVPYVVGTYSFFTDQGIVNPGNAGQIYGNYVNVTNSAGPFTVGTLSLGLFGTSLTGDGQVRLTGTPSAGGAPIVVVLSGIVLASLGSPSSPFNLSSTALAGVQLSALKIEPVEPGPTTFNGSVVVDNVGLGSGGGGVTDGPLTFTDQGVASNNVAITDSNGNTVNLATLTSDGQPVKFVLLDAVTLVAFTGSAPTTINDANVVFSAVLSGSGSGSYTFVQKNDLDHPIAGSEDDLVIKLNYTAKDFDGDKQDGSFTVTIDDDAPVLTSTVSDTARMDDEAQTLFGANTAAILNDVDPNVSTASGQLFNAGADGLSSFGIGAAQFNVIVKNPVTGLSNVETAAFDPNPISVVGGVYTFIATSAHYPSTNPAAELIVRADGSYTVNVYAPVFGSFSSVGSEEDQVIAISYTAVDGDNDAASGKLNIRINDDTVLLTSVVLDTDVMDDEAQTLFGANDAVIAGDATPNVSTASGQLFNAGADGLSSFAIGAAQFNVIFKDATTGLSNVELAAFDPNPISVVGGVYTFIATSAHYPSTSPAAELIVRADGSYTVNVYAPVFGTVSSTTSEEDQTIAISYTVVDGDNDFASGTLNVRVNDDTVLLTSTVLNTDVMDDEAQTLFGKNDAVIAGDVTPNVSTASGQLFNAGADGLYSFQIGAAQFNVIVKNPVTGLSNVETATFNPNPVSVVGGVYTFIATSTSYGNTNPAAELIVRADGSYTVNVYAPVFSTAGSDTTNEEDQTIAIGYTVVDGDNDFASGTLNVRVNDDTVLLTSTVLDTARMDDEAQTLFGANTAEIFNDVDPNVSTASGQLFNAGADGLYSFGIAATQFNVIFKDATTGLSNVELAAFDPNPISVVGGVYTFIATSAHYPSTSPAAELIVRADGSYTVNVYAPVFGSFSSVGAEEDQTIAINYNVVDGDNDFASGTLNIRVNDDTVLTNGAVTASTTIDDDAQTIFSGNNTPDDGVANTNTASGVAGALFNAGADGVYDITLGAVTAFSVIYSDVNGAPQQESVSWGSPVVVGGAYTWTAIGGTTGTAAATLTINANGSYSFTALKPLVHSSNSTTEENLALTFNYTVTDGDNDTATGSLTVNVNDDAPTATATVLSGDVFENELSTATGDASTGTQAGNTDNKNTTPNTDDTILTGTLTSLVSFGADGPAFAVEATNLSSSLTSLTSNGVPLTYSVSGNTLVAKAGNVEIFTFAVDANTGGYTFTLKGPLDHFGAGGATVSLGGGQVPLASIDDIGEIYTTPEINGNFLAFEGRLPDGDVIIKVTNKSNSAVNWTLDNLDGGTDYPLSIAANTTIFINVGPISTPPNVQFQLDGVGAPSGGNGKTVVNSGHGLIVTSSGGTGSEEIVLDLSSAVTVSDGDGDTLALTNQLLITVHDDAPTAGAAPAIGVVDEDERIAMTGNIATETGNFTFNFGADGAGAIAVNPAVSVAGVTGPLQSGGKTVQYDFIGGTLVGYVDSLPVAIDAANVVFSVDLSTSGTGSYTFTLRQPLDHSGSPAGTPITMTFSVTGSDGDGDAGSTSFAIQIDPAGSVSSIDYANLTTGVFVNLADAATTVGAQTVAANTATDNDNDMATLDIVGNDNVAGIVNALGGSGDDILVGGAEANTLTGNGGNDQIWGGAGSDIIDGGAGDDVISYNVGHGSDIVHGGDNTDELYVYGDANGNAFAVTNTDGDPSSLEVTVDGATSLVDGVEDIFIVGNGGTDTLTVDGNLNGTGLSQSTINFDAGAGDDTLDLRLETSAHRVVSDGGTDNDTVKFGFAYPGLAGVQAISGTTDGVSLTFNTPQGPVTHDLRSYESFEFTDGTRTFAQLFNSPPDTQAGSGSGNEDTLIAVTLNGTDVDFNLTSYVITSLPANGTLYLNANGTGAVGINTVVTGMTVYFQPAANWAGSTSFDYAARDAFGEVDATPSTASVTVTAVADAPVVTIDGSTSITAVGPQEDGFGRTSVGGALITFTSRLLDFVRTEAGETYRLVESAVRQGAGAESFFDITWSIEHVETGRISTVQVPSQGIDPTPSLIVLDDGSLMVGWGISRNVGFGASAGREYQPFYQTFSADLTPQSAPVSLTNDGVRTRFGAATDLEKLSDGSLVMVWRTTADEPIMVQHFAADGSPSGAAVAVPGSAVPNPNPAAHIPSFENAEPRIVLLDNGYALAWSFENSDQVQRFNNNGSPAGAIQSSPHPADADLVSQAVLDGGSVVFLYRGAASVEVRIVAPGGAVSPVTVEAQSQTFDASIIALDSGNFVVSWSVIDGSNLHSFIRLFTPAGLPATLAIEIDGAQPSSTVELVAELPNGEFAVVWQADGSLFLQRYDQDGDAVGGRLLLQSLDRDEDGRPIGALDVLSIDIVGDHFVVTWLGSSIGFRTYESHTQEFALAPTVTGDEDSAILVPVSVALADTDGSESLSVTISGAPVGSILTDGANTFNVSSTAAVVVTGWTLSALTVTPPANYSGTFNLTVIATATEALNNDTESTTKTIQVTVTPVNDLPVTVADAITVNEGGTATILVGGATSVLANDTDADNNVLNAVLVNGPANGALTLNPNGTFSYVHNGSETTSDSFTYRANDGTADGNVVTVNITVNPVNDAPVALPDSNGVLEDGSLNVAASVGVIQGAIPQSRDTDADNTTDSLLVSGVAKGAGSSVIQGTGVGTPIAGDFGTLTLSADGSYTYAANNANSLAAGVQGFDAFNYTVVDPSGAFSTEATIRITVTGVNDAAVITGSDAGTVVEATASSAGTPTFSGDLNSTDVDGVNDSWQPVTTPTASANNYGTYTVDAAGNWTYALDNTNPVINALNNGETRTDTFAVLTSDGTSKTVTITIDGATDNAPPVFAAAAATGSITEDGSFAGNLLKNAAFHQGSEYWKTTGTAIYSGGSQAVLFNSNTANEDLLSLSQTVTTVIGQTYTLTFSLAANGVQNSNPMVPVVFNVNATGGPTTPVAFINEGFPPAPHYFSYQFTASSTTTTVTFSAVPFDFGGIQVDDVLLVAGNGPATFAGSETTKGSIDFTDANAGDTHSITSIVPGAGVYYGNFTAIVDNATDKVNWTFTVDDDRIQELVGPKVQTYTLTLDDGHGGNTTKEVSVTINGVNDAPGGWTEFVAGLVSPPTTVAENAANGTVVGDAYSYDIDHQPGQFITYSLDNNADGRFAIGSAGEVTVANGSLLDFEAATSHTITVRATDALGAFSTFDYKIAVTDVAENAPPIVMNDTNIQVLKTNASNFTFASLALLWNDMDTDPLIVESVSGNNDASLSTDGQTVTFKVQGNTGSSASFNYVATDGISDVTGLATVTRVSALTSSTGNDILIADQGGSHQIFGQLGKDVIIGQSNATNDLYGDGVFENANDGNDLLIGGSNATNILTGGGGNDLLIGGVQAGTTMNGGGGNDVLRIAQNANGNVDGGAGNDLLDFSNLGSAANFTLVQSASNTSLNVDTYGGNYKNIEGVIGTRFADTLNGSSSNDTIRGGAGGDTISGLGGNDTLSGGRDGDRFAFTLTGVSNADAILDFSNNEGDKIDLSALLGAGTGAAANGSNINQYVKLTQQMNNDVLVQVDVDGAGAGGFANVATLQGYGTSNADIVRIAFQNAEHQLSV